jgi:hypothetical protein
MPVSHEVSKCPACVQMLQLENTGASFISREVRETSTKLKEILVPEEQVLRLRTVFFEEFLTKWDAYMRATVADRPSPHSHNC